MKEIKAELIADLKAQLKEAADKEDFKRLAKLAGYLQLLVEDKAPQAPVAAPAEAPKGKRRGRAPKEPKAAKRKRERPPVGAKLSAKYHGVEYFIEVSEKGYIYNGVEYTSLGKIAELIAGPGKGLDLLKIKRWIPVA